MAPSCWGGGLRFHCGAELGEQEMPWCWLGSRSCPWPKRPPLLLWFPPSHLAQRLEGAARRRGGSSTLLPARGVLLPRRGHCHSPSASSCPAVALMQPRRGRPLAGTGSISQPAPLLLLPLTWLNLLHPTANRKSQGGRAVCGGAGGALKAVRQLFACLWVPEYKSKCHGCAGTGNGGGCLPARWKHN